MKTQKEILARIEERKGEDLLGFEIPVYMDFLDFEHAKEFLTDKFMARENAEDLYGNSFVPGTQKKVKEVMANYLPFAKMKADDQRGISAGRSMSHYVAWLWLLDDSVAWPAEKIKDLENYTNYGIPQLKEIAEYLGVDYDSLSYEY